MAEGPPLEREIRGSGRFSRRTVPRPTLTELMGLMRQIPGFKSFDPVTQEMEIEGWGKTMLTSDFLTIGSPCWRQNPAMTSTIENEDDPGNGLKP